MPAGDWELEPHIREVTKEERKKHGCFAFDLPSEYGSAQTYVIFKCQREAVHLDKDRKPVPVEPDCRSPAVEKGAPAFVAKLNRGGLKKLTIPESLPVCDECKGKSDGALEACLDQKCAYHYMVVDIKNAHVHPVDPMIIIDPN